MSVPDPLLTHDDISAFFIVGFKDDIALGTWDMRQLTPTTRWNLSFDPRGMVFPTGGMHDSDKGQAWNAGGQANDCGDPGFGFNSGTNAQDLCVNNVWHTDSMINRYTRFPVFAEGTANLDCAALRCWVACHSLTTRVHTLSRIRRANRLTLRKTKTRRTFSFDERFAIPLYLVRNFNCAMYRRPSHNI